MEQAGYTIRAKLLTPTDADTASITVETSFGAIPAAAPGSCSLAPTQYTLTTPEAGPCGGALFIVSAQSDQNISLSVRRNQRVAVEDGRIVADLTTPSPTRSPSLVIPSGGTFFIAVVNCSPVPANYVVLHYQVISDPPPPPVVSGCKLTRNPSGAFVLTISGGDFHVGATVTVGGRTPKKIKFGDLAPGSTTTYLTIRLVKKFCGGLPGNIVINNPGPCSSVSAAFFCDKVCNN